MRFDRDTLARQVGTVVGQTRLTDIHTHLFAPQFGASMLWGIDELLTYHYLVAEALRCTDLSYDAFWALSRSEQARLVWHELFVKRTPLGEAARGILTVLEALGLDPSCRDLEVHRAAFRKYETGEHVSRVLDIAGIDEAVMTNDPFDEDERAIWLAGNGNRDSRFRAALRIDVLLNTWDAAAPRMRAWGYGVSDDLGGNSCAEVRRFLVEWIERMDAVYAAVSMPPTFAWPDDSVRSRLLAECVLPAVEAKSIPMALMIGVKRQVNPLLRLAGDGSGRSDVAVVENLCAAFPSNRFLVTFLARENQHELCVAARKFRNLMPFGCWWFVNTPGLIEEITRMRLELLGPTFIPQHSDARVLEQVIYKWSHSRKVIADVLLEKYETVAATGWTVSEDDIRRDVSALLHGNFWSFAKPSPTAEAAARA